MSEDSIKEEVENKEYFKFLRGIARSESTPSKEEED